MTIFSNLVLEQAAPTAQSQVQRFGITILERVSTKTLSLIASVVFFLLFVVLFLLTTLFITPTAPAYAQTAVLTPRQVVEYALTLEKLEADFYRRALTQIESGSLTSLPEPAKAAVRSYGEDETLHVPDLSTVLTALGGNPDAITIPANPNYNAILSRDPFANPEDFLLALQLVEDTGVAAYKGQVQNLQAAGEAGKAVLAGALEIHSVEARHAAGIRYLRQTFYNANVRPWIRKSKEVLYQEVRPDSPIPFGNEAFDGYATRDEVLARVAPILAGS
ncbi:MAG: ferritin-like domain-containing protein [Stenomitos rutilans HA7619-LM2]|jgi:hypothetical protein|nr:ferritin-like domain-containing protein [Stenomitos rutilans HA7619-LM2]